MCVELFTDILPAIFLEHFECVFKRTGERVTLL